MPGGITKKKIKKVSFAGNIYSSTKSAKVKKYIEAKVIEYAESKGLTAKGAEEVKITSPGHSGGTDKNEPFHIGLKALKSDGLAVPTVNPSTGNPTPTHHFYIASDKKDLEKKAEAWDKANK